MQNKGFVKFLAVALTLICLFYLSFSVATKWVEDKAAKMDAQQAELYLDSLNTTEFYLGNYTLKDCRETAIGLGLDLKGGMNVILEVSVPDLVENLADHKTTPGFVRAMEMARAEEEKTQGDFISIFVKCYHQAAPGHSLAEIFATQELKDEVKTTSSDADVEKVLRKKVADNVNDAKNVITKRIDKFGVVQPNIQMLEGQEGRIMVEMPGVREPERMRKLLQGSANLEFWETYSSDEIVPYLVQLDQRLAGGDEEEASADTTAVKTDSAAVAAPVKSKFQIKKADNKKNIVSEETQAKKLHPLLSMLQTMNQQLSMVGMASIRDTAAINKMLHSAIAKQVLPSDVKLLWSAKPTDLIKNNKKIYELHAIKVTTSDGRAPIEGDVVTDASDQFNNLTGQPEVSMTMNQEGAREWAALTKANVGRAIAIVLDGAVYSSPRVNGEISGGQSSISGNFTVEDTKDLANTLKSGRMKAPVRIVQEEVVGPSLGAQSIQQGLTSFVIAFVLLIIFMVMLYGFIPGMVANTALILNLFFTLGIMASFQSALTMPGIAGIVLTLGMAVDANVLIYERTREELKVGKNIQQAIAEGYGNAFSAIFDSNLTSIITGVILLVFGTGPIRGFATTLIIGIICSFFTAVFLTRLVYERQMKKDKWLGITFDTAFSRGIFRNPTYRFMSMAKKTFTFTAVVVVLFAISFAVRGLSRSIDFTGGRNYVIKFEKPTEPEQIREVLANAFPGSNVGALALGTDGMTIRVSTNYKIESNSPSVDNEVENILFKQLSKAGLVTQKSVEAFKNPDIRQGGSIISSTKVGPAVAKDITNGAIISVIIALFAIFIYILIRFSNVAFSIGSIVALAVDTVIVIGCFSACWGWMPFSLEIDQSFIGAILTVIGYSINDKVIVFDRIRENLKLHPKQELGDLFNESINQTLARTVKTSATTLLVLLCIFFLGGESIRSFSFAMIIGVVVGTLSSIFIAAPTAYLTLGHKHNKQNKNLAAAEA